MNRNILLIIVVIVLLIITLITIFSEDGETTDVPVDTTPEEEASRITIKDFKLNGLDGNVKLTTEDPSVITATLINETEEEQEIELKVVQDGQSFDERHGFTYTIAPGETKEIEEVREEHKTWYVGEFTVMLGDQTIEVIVE
jgi:hypothetical protein